METLLLNFVEYTFSEKGLLTIKHRWRAAYMIGSKFSTCKLK